MRNEIFRTDNQFFFSFEFGKKNTMGNLKNISIMSIPNKLREKLHR